MEQSEFTILQALRKEGFRLAEAPIDLGSLPDLILLHAAPADDAGTRLRFQMLSASPSADHEGQS